MRAGSTVAAEEEELLELVALHMMEAARRAAVVVAMDISIYYSIMVEAEEARAHTQARAASVAAWAQAAVTLRRTAFCPVAEAAADGSSTNMRSQLHRTSPAQALLVSSLFPI